MGFAQLQRSMEQITHADIDILPQPINVKNTPKINQHRSEQKRQFNRN